MLKRTAVVVVSCGALLAGCGDEPRTENEEILSNLTEAGFPADDIRIVDGAVYVGGDAQVSLQASREMLQTGPGSEEQYRTFNLVSTSIRKICINPTSTFNSYSRLIQGLDLAIGNFNALGLTFTLARGPTTGCEANITASTSTGTTLSSGFPMGGLPYGQISIGAGFMSFSPDLIEHVITHSLGHTIGLHHSDYYDRTISCGLSGGGVTEPAPGTPIHIPGTPTTATPGGSVMNTCYRSTELGEFTSSDIIALHYLY